jgi:hypothetical protein
MREKISAHSSRNLFAIISPASAVCIRIGESVVLQVTTTADIGCFYISAEAVLLAVWVVV